MFYLWRKTVAIKILATLNSFEANFLLILDTGRRYYLWADIETNYAYLNSISLLCYLSDSSLFFFFTGINRLSKGKGLQCMIWWCCIPACILPEAHYHNTLVIQNFFPTWLDTMITNHFQILIMVSILLPITALPVAPGHTVNLLGTSLAKDDGKILQRSKRGWMWNQFFLLEEYTGNDNQYVGKVRVLCAVFMGHSL